MMKCVDEGIYGGVYKANPQDVKVETWRSGELQESDEREPDEEGKPADQESSHNEPEADRDSGLPPQGRGDDGPLLAGHNDNTAPSLGLGKTEVLHPNGRKGLTL